MEGSNDLCPKHQQLVDVNIENGAAGLADSLDAVKELGGSGLEASTVANRLRADYLSMTPENFRSLTEAVTRMDSKGKGLDISVSSGEGGIPKIDISGHGIEMKDILRNPKPSELQLAKQLSDVYPEQSMPPLQKEKIENYAQALADGFKDGGMDIETARRFFSKLQPDDARAIQRRLAETQNASQVPVTQIICE